MAETDSTSTGGTVAGTDEPPLGMEVAHRAPPWARRFYSYFGFSSVLSELDE